MTGVLVVGVLAAMLCGFAAAGEMGLVDENVFIEQKEVVPRGEPKPEITRPSSVLVSPDGTRLLYLRARQAKVKGEDRTVRQLVLHNLATKEVTVLPLPLVTSDFAFYYLFGSSLFDPSGTKLVLGVGIDQDDDGVVAPGQPDPMQAAICDVATGKVRMLDLKGPAIIPGFDRTGKHIYALSYDVKTNKGTLHKADAGTLEFKPVEFLGLPCGYCPGADVTAMLIRPVEPKGAWGYKLVLYDTKADRQICELPSDGPLFNLLISPVRWTADGRYLYYRDNTMQPFKEFTCVWDRTASKQAARLEGMFPIGPGPGATMVMTKPFLSDLRGIVVHDATTGKTWELAGNDVQPFAAAGGRVFYMKFIRGGHAFCSAAIALPGRPE